MGKPHNHDAPVMQGQPYRESDDEWNTRDMTPSSRKSNKSPKHAKKTKSRNPKAISINAPESDKTPSGRSRKSKSKNKNSVLASQN